MIRLVPRTGFEPVVSSLRGRCPGPLDERATAATLAIRLMISASFWLAIQDSNLGSQIQSLVSYR